MSNMFLFLVGAPGVGKTSVVRELLDPDSWFSVNPKWTVGETVCAAGHYKGETFDGADTVPYNGVEKALAFWDSDLSKYALTIFDGDRFSHQKVADWAKARGKVVVVRLYADEATLKARREARGSKQNPAWMKGRETKAERFCVSNNGHPLDYSSGFGTADVSVADIVRSVQSLTKVKGRVPT